MAKPHVQVFSVSGPDGPFELAAVVLDQEEFDALVDEVVQVSMAMGVDEAMGEQIKKAGHIPMVARGTKTEFLFERFGVDGDRLAMIVRGTGDRLLQALAPDPERN